MTSTVFQSGTVIDSVWLNDVNDKTYADPVPVALAASSGSSLVGYLPAGTGAVVTTVQEKLRESVSASEHGGVDTGLVDDSIAEGSAFTVADSIRSIFRSLWMYKFPKRGLKVWKRTFGIKDQAAVVSITTGDDITEPTTEVLGFSTDSDVSVYPDRDNVALFVQANALPALVTTSSTIFTAISVSSVSFAPAIAAGQIKLGMMIDTNEAPKKTGVVNGINAGTSTLSVSAWYVVDGTRATGTPANGVTVYVSPATKVWALNANVSISPTSHASEVVGIELGLVNTKAPGIGYLYDAVNLDTFSGGNAFQARGTWNASFYSYVGSAFGFVSQNANTAGYYAQGTSPAAFLAQITGTGFIAKTCGVGFAHQDSNGNNLSYTDGVGTLYTSKVSQQVVANGDTINSTAVVCRTGLISTTCIVNLPPPGDNNVGRLLYLKNANGSTISAFFAGVVEGGGGSIVVPAGTSNTVYSDGGSWAII